MNWHKWLAWAELSEGRERKAPAIVGVTGASATEGVGWTGPTPPKVDEFGFEMVKGLTRNPPLPPLFLAV